MNIVKVCNHLLINVYLPCSGTENRQMICTDLLADIWSRRECFSDCECVVAGDFNAVLDNNNAVSQCLTNFLNDCSLVRCDDLFPSQKADTYVNVALGHQSQIDYALVSNTNEVSRFAVLEPRVNFSDHLPLLLEVSFSYSDTANRLQSNYDRFTSMSHLRWDKGDKASYYFSTGQHLQPLVTAVDKLMDDYRVINVDTECACNCIESMYTSIVSVLCSAADIFVPKCRKGFFKHWWDEELSLLKEASVDSNKAWKAIGLSLIHI